MTGLILHYFAFDFRYINFLVIQALKANFNLFNIIYFCFAI